MKRVGQNWPKVCVSVPNRTFLIFVLQSVGYLTLHALHVFLYRVVDESLSTTDYAFAKFN